jgi:hypothetical protein
MRSSSVWDSRRRYEGRRGSSGAHDQCRAASVPSVSLWHRCRTWRPHRTRRRRWAPRATGRALRTDLDLGRLNHCGWRRSTGDRRRRHVGLRRDTRARFDKRPDPTTRGCDLPSLTVRARWAPSCDSAPKVEWRSRRADARKIDIAAPIEGCSPSSTTSERSLLVPALVEIRGSTAVASAGSVHGEQRRADRRLERASRRPPGELRAACSRVRRRRHDLCHQCRTTRWCDRRWSVPIKCRRDRPHRCRPLRRSLRRRSRLQAEIEEAGTEQVKRRLPRALGERRLASAARRCRGTSWRSPRGLSGG